MLHPWESEPDREDWEYCELKCRIIRADFGGHLCGYVGIPFGHPYFEKKPSVKVHGGITWAKLEEGLWWLGFDCGHCFDISPLMNLHIPGAEYRDFEYVRNQVNNLAEQLSCARN